MLESPKFSSGDSTGNDSLELLFLNSPFLIVMAAAVLAAIPLGVAMFMSFHLGQNSSNSHSTKLSFSPKSVCATSGTQQTSQRNKFCSRGKLFKIFRRFFAFYVDTFYIPQYRTEWGKYKVWSFRAKDRRHRPLIIKESMKRLKMEEKKKSMEFQKRLQGIGSDYYIPRPVAHNHLDCAKVRINVNGCLFVTQERTLISFPNSLLGNLSRRIQFYDPASDTFFFDRSRASFEAILHFFQSGGQFRRPENVHLDVFLDDAEFYGIPLSIIEAFRKDEGLEKEESMERVPTNLYSRKLWLLFDNPQSSYPGRIFACLSVSVVILSIVSFIAETHVAYSVDGAATNTKGSQSSLVNGKVEEMLTDQNDFLDPFLMTETVCVAWFTIELVVRFVTSPSKSDFVSSTLNLIDISAILPYYLSIIFIKTVNDSREKETGGAMLAIETISVLRLIRVLRVFKLSRHSEGLKILGRTLRASISELFLLVFFVLIGVVLFSSAMYLIEGSSNDDFSSIPAGFWWALITMTTVGYGDDVPRTWTGKVIGSICAVAGVFTIALPVPVIVSNFNYFYHQAIDEAQFNLARINHVDICPFRPGGEGKFRCWNAEIDSDDAFDSLKFENKKQQ